MTATLLESTYPLTPVQEGMLFHSRLAGGGLYIQQLVVTLPEAVDADALRQAWQLVTDHHAILRTAFPGDGTQTVADDIEVPFEELDWSGRSSDFDDWLATDRRRGFDFAVPPLWRLTLIRRGPADFVLIWTFHHALLDGRSHRLVLEEAFTAYEAFREGNEPSLPPARPFWEHVEWLQSRDAAAAEQYWRGVLAGCPLASPGFAGEGRPLASSELVLVIPESTSTALKAFAAENGLTATTLIQAAWAVLLARYSGETDVVFGGIRRIAGDPPVGDPPVGDPPGLSRRCVGLQINTLPVRANVTGDTSVLDLLASLRLQWVAGREFAHAAPVDIQTWAGLPGGTPLYGTIVVTENHDLDEALRGLGGSWAKRSVRLCEAPHYPLALTVAFDREIRLRLLYDRNRIDAAAAGRLLGHVRTLLEAIPDHAAAPVRELPMLTAAERQQVLFDWNDTAGDFPRNRRLEQLVEEQVDRTPDAVAVVHEGRPWTYRELDERANRLARHLRSILPRVNHPGQIMVAVCMNRSAEMVAAVLGILKSGAAYVPLDPACPKDRLAFLLGDVGAAALVTQVRRLDRLPETAIPVVCIDADWPMIALHPAERLGPANTSEDIAYVIYTSGSTGTPKGVVLRHRAVVNTIDWVNQTFAVGPGDRVLWVTSLCFDLSIYDLFGVLAAGGAVRVATGSELRDPERLLRDLGP